MSTKPLTAAINIGQTETISQHTKGGYHLAEVNLDKYGWALVAFLAKKLYNEFWEGRTCGMCSSDQRPLECNGTEQNTEVARQIVANYLVESESKQGNTCSCCLCNGFSTVALIQSDFRKLNAVFPLKGLIWKEYTAVKFRINAVCHHKHTGDIRCQRVWAVHNFLKELMHLFCCV